jgi:hypothetical protein
MHLVGLNHGASVWKTVCVAFQDRLRWVMSGIDIWT